MIRAFTAWSWLISATGAAVMYAPHVPMLVLRRVADAVRSPR